MKLSQDVLVWSLLLLTVPPSLALAQDSVPRLGYAYPAGGQQGTSFQVTVGGQFLNDVGRITFTGTGVEAQLVEGIKPMTDMDVRTLRDRLTALAKNQKELAARREMAEIQRKLARHLAAQLRRQIHPAIAETVELKVTIEPGAEPGLREMRLETVRGVSAPLRFLVGRLPEYREQEPEFVTDFQDYSTPIRFPATVTTDISLPATVNGQIIPREPDALRFGGGFTPGDADRYRFAAKRGQTIIVSAAARELIPYLPDAVPGWFQATLSLFDGQGRELVFRDDYRFHPDPVIVFKVPADGDYVVEIKDAIYRGRPDFVYRITIGEIPFVTAIFPLGGRAGEKTIVELSGHNLPEDKLTFDGRDKPAGVYPVFLRRLDFLSNAVKFSVDTLAEQRETEPNHSSSQAESVRVPLIVNGRIDQPGDEDGFRFEGKAGQRIIAEVDARRLGSPLDSVLQLTDAVGKRLAFNDDREDKADALNTHHADSLIDVTLPDDGAYVLRLADAQDQGGSEFAYRLRVSEPRPDFALRVVPSCINASSWRLTPVTLFALRKDGFAGDIDLSLKDNPPGVILIGGRIPAGQERVRATLSVAPWAAVEPISLQLEGHAVIDGGDVVRAAVGADDMMQAFAYRHLVPAENLRLVCAESGRFRPGANLPKPPSPGSRPYQAPSAVTSEQPVKVPIGGTADVQIRSSVSSRGSLQFELTDAPEGIAIDGFTWQDRNLIITLRCDAEKAKPGLGGNLIANVFQQRTETNKEGKTREYRSFMGPLPAIQFEIVKP